MARINDALWDLRELYRAEPNPIRKQQLQDEYDRALSAALEMTERDISGNTAAYTKAVNALEKSIAELKKAKREIGDVEKAIRNVAKAVDGIGKVAGKVAGLV